MKFTTVIVLVVVMCVVVMEAKLTKEEKQAKRQARRQNKKNNKEACQKQITFSTCDATTNKMNRTITTCKKNGQSKTFERNCTEIKKYTVHSTCEITRTIDFTACADANENLRNATVTVTVSADCAQHGISGMSESLRCDTNKLDKALRMSTKAVLKGVKNGGGKGAGRKNKNERKQNRKDRKANRGNKQMGGNNNQ